MQLKKSPEWIHRCAELSTQRGYIICGRENRQGGPCEKRRVPGRDACNLHGGKSPQGIASPAYKHGRFSRYSRAGKLGEAYQQQMGDLEYVALRDDMAAITALAAQQWDLLATLPSATEPGIDPQEAHRRDQAWQKAYSRWRELVADRNRLTRTEVRRIQVAEDSLSGQQVAIFSQVVLEAVRRNIAALASKVGFPYELVVKTMGDIQDDVYRAQTAASNRMQEAGIDDMGAAEDGE